MKKTIYSFAAIAAWALTFAACDSFREAGDVSDITPLYVNVEGISEVETVTSLEGLTVTCTNNNETYKVEATLGADNKVRVPNLIPGVYNVSIKGKKIGSDDLAYTMAGDSMRLEVLDNVAQVKIDVKGLIASPIIIKEVYFANSKSNTGGSYLFDQFYELYNNSEDGETIYLDGLYFCDIVPMTATTTLPKWPDGVNTKDNVFCSRVWKFPGDGDDYPLKPGESCVMAQRATNHKAANNASPTDNTSAEFEFCMGNPLYDYAADNMSHVFYNGNAAIGTVPQWLTSVFGGAYALFRVPAGETYDPATITSQKSQQATGTTWYAILPIRYILDAVEAGHNETMLAAKRIPSVLDAGMTYVGATYCGLSVCRKMIEGETLPDGSPKLMDTNNSTDDFDRMLTPQLRRYDTKMPSWNHTLR